LRASISRRRVRKRRRKLPGKVLWYAKQKEGKSTVGGMGRGGHETKKSNKVGRRKRLFV